MNLRIKNAGLECLRKKRGQAPFSFTFSFNDIEGKSVVASKAWQSLREKEDLLFSPTEKKL
jgi:hypothetical protein